MRTAIFAAATASLLALANDDSICAGQLHELFRDQRRKRKWR